MLRKIVSLTTVFSFLFLIISSAILYITPEGRIANWAGWTVFFTKSQWEDIHITGGVLFIIFGIWHSLLNFKVIVNYCKTSFSLNKYKFVPFFASLFICIFVYGGTLYDIPPMQQLISWNTSIKNYQATKYGEPPFGHAEISTLRQFCAFLGMDADAVLTAMKAAGFKGDPQPDKTVWNIAAANGMTSQQLYEFMIKITGMPDRPTGRSMPPGNGKGAGRRFAGEN